MGQTVRIAALVARKPTLILGMLRASWVFRTRNWYRKPPFLPVPPRAYMRWRLDTAYGDPDAVPRLGELSRFLRWSQQLRRRIKEMNRIG